MCIFSAPKASSDLRRYKPLHSQFKKAATLIAARAERQAERDFFFVENGGRLGFCKVLPVFFDFKKFLYFFVKGGASAFLFFLVL